MANLQNYSLNQLLCATNGINDLLINATKDAEMFSYNSARKFANLHQVMLLNEDLIIEIRERIPESLLNDR